MSERDYPKVPRHDQKHDEDQRQTALHTPGRGAVSQADSERFDKAAPWQPPETLEVRDDQIHNMIGDTAIGAPAPEVFPAANTATHPGLPVKGYQRQSQWAVDVVNGHKEDEERLLRHLDHLKKDGDIDQRWLAVARTQFEKAYMALNRAVFQPGRVTLPEDHA